MQQEREHIEKGVPRARAISQYTEGANKRCEEILRSSKNQLKQIEEELPKKKVDSASVIMYDIKIFKSPRDSK